MFGYWWKKITLRKYAHLQKKILAEQKKTSPLSSEKLKTKIKTDLENEAKYNTELDFEEAISEKNKTIYKLEKERDSALSARAKMEKTVDDLKAEKVAALDKAERADSRPRHEEREEFGGDS